MTEISIFALVGMMVVFVLVRGYTTKTLGQLGHECSSLTTEERRLRGERDQEEIILESAEAKQRQAAWEVQKFNTELEDLAKQQKEIQAALGRPQPGEDEEEEES